MVGERHLINGSSAQSPLTRPDPGLANEIATCLRQGSCSRGESVTAVDRLATLNDAQRAAVEHGDEALPQPSSPLLIIAGAGSGKTNTLAHRVAHLIISGADPRRILLLTFSRRAAAEMIRRVERIAASQIAADHP